MKIIFLTWDLNPQPLDYEYDNYSFAPLPSSALGQLIISKDKLVGFLEFNNFPEPA